MHSRNYTHTHNNNNNNKIQYKQYIDSNATFTHGVSVKNTKLRVNCMTIDSTFNIIKHGEYGYLSY
jgi:hypothetical protein